MSDCTQQGGVRQGLPSGTQAHAGIDRVDIERSIDPRSAVEALSIEDLAYIVSNDTLLGSLENSDERLPAIKFCCPICRFENHNGGSAYIVDAWTWACSRCRAPSQPRSRRGDVRRTRYMLERYVLEDAECCVAARQMVTRVDVDV